jgi:hypothetical protein
MHLLLVAASSILTEGIVHAYDRPRQPKDGCVDAPVKAFEYRSNFEPKHS